MWPVALLCSDFHASLNSPVVRSAEPDWKEAMRRPLRQIKELQKELGNVPVLFAGDLYDRWNSPAELTNFLLEELPDNFWAVPGQHDLPLHSYDDVKRSAYWTLVAAGKIEDANTVVEGKVEARWIKDTDLCVWGFPWGHLLKPPVKRMEGYLNIALVHRYCWSGSLRHPEAEDEGHYSSFQDVMQGFDLIVIGDNHQHFYKQGSGNSPAVWNCGSLMRRRADEIVHRPSVGILTSNGMVRRHHLDCSEDKFLEDAKVEELISGRIDLADFVDELSSLEEAGIDFVDVVHRFLAGHKIGRDAARVVLEVLDHAQGK